MDKQQSKIRIKDIALKAGVSAGTVDRVIHRRKGVSASSRTKVEKILKQMNYQPNAYASALAANKQYTFICLLPLHTPDDYWAVVEQGMKKAASAFSDFNVTLHTIYYDPYESKTFTSAGNIIDEMRPDGVILAPIGENETLVLVEQLKKTNTPYVCIDSYFPTLAPLSFFGQHAQQSGHFAARILSLVAATSKEIAIFRLVCEGKAGSNQQMEREKGFKETIQKYHPDVKLLELDLFIKHPESNESLMNEFFQLHPEVTCGVTFHSRAYLIGEYMQQHAARHFHLLGYDLVPRNINCLRSGLIDFIIAQQPSAQGYGSVEALCNQLILKKNVKQLHYMPLSLITIENLDFYLDTNSNNE